MYLYKLSVVSPVYQASGNIEELTNRLVWELTQLTTSFEIILVDDGSYDSSWQEITDSSKKHHQVKGIKLSRNFGQHYAVTAGLEFTEGERIIIMDCDLQDDPSIIGKLCEVAEKGNDIVFTKRIRRKHSLAKSIGAGLYNLLFNILSDPHYEANTGSMVLITDRVRRHYLQLEDHDRLYVQLLKWIGFKQSYIAIEHNSRFSGASSYNFLKLLNLATQGWTSHSTKLLKLSIYLGFGLSIATSLISLYIVFQYFNHGFQPGWPSLFIAILFSTGLILMSIGITGIYIGKIFEQAKRRPLYIIDSKVNFP